MAYTKNEKGDARQSILQKQQKRSVFHPLSLA